MIEFVTRGRPEGRNDQAEKPLGRATLMLAQQLANGLVLGSIYALSALGFTLIFGAARVVNFAYGELLMMGAFFTLTRHDLFGAAVLRRPADCAWSASRF